MNELLTEENAHVLSFFQRLDDIEENVRSLSLNRKPVLNGECYLTDQELSERLKVSRRTLQTYRNEGRIPYVPLGGKVLYRESDVERMLQEGYRKAWRLP